MRPLQSFFNVQHVDLGESDVSSPVNVGAIDGLSQKDRVSQDRSSEQPTLKGFLAGIDAGTSVTYSHLRLPIDINIEAPHYTPSPDADRYHRRLRPLHQPHASFLCDWSFWASADEARVLIELDRVREHQRSKMIADSHRYITQPKARIQTASVIAYAIGSRRSR